MKKGQLNFEEWRVIRDLLVQMPIGILGYAETHTIIDKVIKEMNKLNPKPVSEWSTVVKVKITEDK